VWVVVGAATYALLGFVPGASDSPVSARVVLSVLLGLVAAANSPAVVMAMINEYRAEGPLARTTLAVTIFKDMLMVVLFATVLALGRGWISEHETVSATFLLAVGVQLVGSLVLGAAAGAVMALYVHRVGSHLVIFLIGACMAFALVGEQKLVLLGEGLHMEPLLMGLAAGMMMENLWPAESEPLFGTIEAMSLPVYCLFFALAGAKVDLTVLATVWAAGVVAVLVVMRGATVWASVGVAARLVGFDAEQRGRLWMGFIPQAGIALALAALVSKTFEAQTDPIFANVLSLLIGMIAINEIVGPIGLRYSLLRSGEAWQARQANDSQ
jgi:Kef-type K+ transport system membrane component KefB